MARLGQARRMVILAAMCSAAGKPIPSIWPEGLEPRKAAMSKWVANLKVEKKVDKKSPPKKKVSKDASEEEKQ